MNGATMKPPFVRTPYNYDRDEASNDSGLKCLDKTRTQQNFADEVNINTIVKRFNLTGQLPADVRQPTYADFVGPFDFHQAMNAIRQAQEAFDRMPADLRAEFHNDPGEFVDFCSNDENRARAEKMGLVLPKDLKKVVDPATGEVTLDPAKPSPSDGEPRETPDPRKKKGDT